MQQLERLAVPVAMYDVEQTDPTKKLLAVFSSLSVAGRYVYNTRSGYEGKNLQSYVVKKHKMLKNRFGRVLCFRNASVKQMELMKGSGYVILDSTLQKNTVSLLNER